MKVGDSIEMQRGNWNFGGNVADTFVEHAQRSIPMYDAGHSIVCELSDFFCQPDSLAYEIGCSTGELIRKLAEFQSHKPDTRWIGVDREMPMVEHAQAHCADIPNIEIYCDDVLAYPMESADLVVSYYCIQFIPPRIRQEVFDKIFSALNWGGALILFEKVRGPDARFQDIFTQIYTSFKQSQGFSAEEMVNKTASLKGIMEPFSTQGNIDFMKRAGFQDITSVFKYACFEGFLAIK